MAQYRTIIANAMEHAIVPIAQISDLPSIQFSSCACKQPNTVLLCARFHSNCWYY